MSAGYVPDRLCGCLFRPLFLLQPSPSTTHLPCWSRLTPAAYQRTHFVPTPLRPLLQFSLFRVLFIYTAHEPLRPDHWYHQLPPVSIHICKHIKAEIQLSFFCPSLLTTSTVFTVWGYVKEQHPFNLQPSFIPHRKHLSSHGAGERISPHRRALACQSTHQISYYPSAPVKAELKY